MLLADALYATARFVNFLLACGKHALIVLQDERRNLYQDVAGLWRSVPAQPGRYRSRDCQWWDNEGLLSWPQVHQPLRVVRSVETWQLRSQLDGLQQQHGDWAWPRTLSSKQLPTEGVVRLGHQRWNIENQGFNELVNGWHADHVYKHSPRAIENFLLTVFLAFDLFHVFVARNLKPALWRGKPQVSWARVMAGELYQEAAGFGRGGPSPSLSCTSRELRLHSPKRSAPPPRGSDGPPWCVLPPILGPGQLARRRVNLPAAIPCP